MKKKQLLEQSIFLYLYRKYKLYLPPVGLLLLCVLLFFGAILPQFRALIKAREQAAKEQKKLAILEQNLQTVTQYDNTSLNSSYETTSQALPVEKDFIGVLSAITRSANTAGVLIGDYSLAIGNLGQEPAGEMEKDSSSLQLSLVVEGSLAKVKVFIAQLQKQFPLADITSLNGTTNTFTVTILFFYRPFTAKSVDITTPIQLLSTQELHLIRQLTDQQSSLFDVPSPTLVPSPSVSVSPTPVGQ